MQKAIEIKSNDLTLRGMLHTPGQINGKIPAIIILHGFGGNKTGPHFMFVQFSRILAANGIASVRFDFAGSGESDGEFINMTLSGELEDAKNILKYVKSLEFVNTQKIGIVGFSMGGAVASVLAGINGKDVQALCLWAPAGNMADIVHHHFIGEGHRAFLEKGYHDFEGLLIGKAFVEDLNKQDIYRIASEYKGEKLLLHGNHDEVVSLSASEKYMAHYDGKAELTVVDGADHLFSNQEWEQKVLAHSADFFRRRLLDTP